MASEVFFSALVIVLFSSTIAVTAEQKPTDYARREHTFTKPFAGNHWDIKGDVIMSTSYVRLTPDVQSKRGALWNNEPVLYHNWEVHLQFNVHGKGTDGLHGDGMVLWYTKNQNNPGPVFGNEDYFTGLGIFLDTYSNHNGPHNHRHPYISAMINNGSMHYDHDADGTHTELDGCESQFRNKAHDTFIAVRYEDSTLSVSMDVDGKSHWTECFVSRGVQLPTGYYLGVTAATGELADNHDVISVKFYQLPGTGKDEKDWSQVDPSASVFAPPRDHIEDPKSSSLTGWKLFLLIVLLIVGVGVAIIIGAIMYNNQQEKNRKRFY